MCQREAASVARIPWERRESEIHLQGTPNSLRDVGEAIWAAPDRRFDGCRTNPAVPVLRVQERQGQ